MPDSSLLQEFQSKYERPQIEQLIVGFSGIDPQRKSSASGGTDYSYDASKLSDEQINIVQSLIDDELDNFKDNSGVSSYDWDSLSDGQKSVVIQLINSRLTGLKAAYDGGEIVGKGEDDYSQNDDENAPTDDDNGSSSDNQDNDNLDTGDFNFETDHESLNGLLGGDARGHFHLTADEILRLNDYPKISDIKHENLPDLLGGDDKGYYHLTLDELKAIRNVLATFSTSGSNTVAVSLGDNVITITPTSGLNLSGCNCNGSGSGGSGSDSSGGSSSGGSSSGGSGSSGDSISGGSDSSGGSSSGGSGSGGSGSSDSGSSGGIGGNSPISGGSGSGGYSEAGYNYGLPASTPPGWDIKLLPGGLAAHSNIGKIYYGAIPSKTGDIHGLFFRPASGVYVYYSEDLNNWTRTNAISYSMKTQKFNVPQYISTNGGVLNDKYVEELIAINGDAYNSSYIYFTAKESSGNITNTSKSHSGGNKATIVAGAYSPLLKCVIFVDNTANAVYRKTAGVTALKKATSNIVKTNLGCAAWNSNLQIFCISGPSGTSTSPDGETWAKNTDVPKNLKQLTYRDDLQRFLAWSGDDKLFYSSEDGINWLKLNSTPIPLDNPVAVDWNNPSGIVCAVGKGSQYAYFSKDLDHWVGSKIRNSSTVDIADVFYMPSTALYVAMPTDGNYYYTFNPSDWN